MHLSIFDKDDEDQNIEIYLKDPLEADKYKNKIEKLNQNYFVLYLVRFKQISF